ncbi:MAG: radical SAM protein [Clostridiales bacterium]|nr:radical SAM protein [Candidatus Crickella equi]
MKDFPKIGPTVTMFVPYDCKNACPFCVNKKEYRDTSSFDLQRCYRSLDLLDRVFPHNDVVLTGGEPLADLDALQDILDHISDGHHVYINTTLPVDENQTIEEVAAILNKYKDKIDCMNVSRHLDHYVKECSDEIFDLLEFPHRINCVVFESASKPETRDRLIAVLDRFKGHEVQLRANYSYLTLDNVFDTENDHLYQLISDICEYKYDLEKERFRTGFVFEREGSKITYHKTLPFAKIDGVVGDIIIRQTGRIYDDWNEYGHELNTNDLVDLQYK